MKIQSLSFCAAVLAMAIAPAALAQVYTRQAELDLAATGDRFSIGQTEFRLAPSAVVRQTDANTDPSRDVVIGDYVVDVPAAVSGARSKRSLDASATGENLGAAVSEAGATVIVAPELNVYFTQLGVVDEVLARTGGRLLYSSAAGGKATIAYSSVGEAMAARQRILGQAGVKEVSPRLVEQRQVAW